MQPLSRANVDTETQMRYHGSMKIYLATGNLNKKREMQEIFPMHTIVIPKDEGIAFDPEETGTTFYENSIIKAKTLWSLVHTPVLADDSGICVDALGGAPGIYSARYAGAEHIQGLPGGGKVPQEEQNRLLIAQLDAALAAGAGIDEGRKRGLYKNGPRSAHYTCAMVFYAGNDRIFVAQETMEGSIVASISDARGSGGFGYDPLFLMPDGCRTAAELTAEQKNAVSHRGKAARIIQHIVENCGNA